MTAFLATGVASSLTSLWWHDVTISAGASGAIFGLYGVFLALLRTNLLEKSMRGGLFISIFLFVAVNLIGGMKYQVDNAAHIGGLISGIIMGYADVPGLNKTGREPKAG
jgi:rhomboid protease GluP